MERFSNHQVWPTAKRCFLVTRLHAVQTVARYEQVRVRARGLILLLLVLDPWNVQRGAYG